MPERSLARLRLEHGDRLPNGRQRLVQIAFGALRQSDDHEAGARLRGPIGDHPDLPAAGA